MVTRDPTICAKAIPACFAGMNRVQRGLMLLRRPRHGATGQSRNFCKAAGKRGGAARKVHALEKELLNPQGLLRFVPEKIRRLSAKYGFIFVAVYMTIYWSVLASIYCTLKSGLCSAEDMMAVIRMAVRGCVQAV